MLCDRLYEWQLKPTTGPAYSPGGVPDPRFRLFVNLAGGYGHTRSILMPHDSKRSAVLQRNRDRLGTLDHFKIAIGQRGRIITFRPRSRPHDVCRSAGNSRELGLSSTASAWRFQALHRPAFCGEVEGAVGSVIGRLFTTRR
jgi:hypothetical protein